MFRHPLRLRGSNGTMRQLNFGYHMFLDKFGCLGAKDAISNRRDEY